MSEMNIITDSLGRKIEVRCLGAMDQLDLLEATRNQAEYKRWFGMASLIFHCASIDGVPLPMPRKPDDFRKNAAILKTEGTLAIANFLEEKQQQDSTDEGNIEAAKN